MPRPLGHCSDCGRVVHEGERPYFAITGFTRQRTAGGTNHVHDQRATGELVCVGCWHLRHHHGTQLTLGEGEAFA